MAVVYEIKHKASGNAYVGMTARPVKKRWQHHRTIARKGARTYLHAALRKHGFDAFTWTVIATLPTADEAKICERIAIAVRKPVYNATAGGDGADGLKHSMQTRKQMSEIARSRRQVPPARLGTDAARLVNTGLKRSPANCKAISDGLKRLHGSTWTNTTERKAQQAAKARSYYRANRESILKAKEAQRRTAGAKERKPAGQPWR